MWKLASLLENVNWMTHRCEKCPGNENFKNYPKEMCTGRNKNVINE